ncbi:MAG: HD domain-containing protein [Saccharofermentans sp.]|nr:HD domain-containing protein [Saccharofermentans sp.]
MIFKSLIGICALLSLLVTFTLVYLFRHGNNAMQIVLATILTISNCGYYFLTDASTLEEALLANTIGYIGGLFLPMLVMVLLADFSNSKLPRWFVLFIALMNIVLFAGVATTNEYGLFYSAVELVVKDSGVAYLVKTAGVLYYIRFVVLAVEVALSFFFTLLAFIGRRAASYKTMMLYIVMVIISMMTYVVERAVHSSYEFLPFVYLLCIFLLVYICTRSILYDVYSTVQEKISENTSFAYVVFDSKLNFVSCNSRAKRILPELKNARIDSPIVTENFAFKTLLNWVKDNAFPKDPKASVTTTLILNENRTIAKRLLDCELSYIRLGLGTRILGYLIELNDVTEQHDMIEQLKFHDIRSKREADRQTLKVKNLQESTILGMASMIESRDNSTGGHINRTSSCVALFVEHLRKVKQYRNFPDSYWYAVKQAAVLHDLGKIGVDDYILRKTSGLSEEEYAAMKTHAEKGAVIIRKILKDVDDREFVRVAENVAHYHHEKYNGTGYPDHLKDNQIPLEARIMALADVFDALASKRAYKEPMPYSECFKIIRHDLGSHFDPELGEIFLGLEKEIIALYESFEGTDKAR